MSTVTPNYEIDYEDKAFTDITDAKNEALTNNQTMYDNMIGGVDEKYQGIADTVQSNADKMAQIQQENTDFQIQQIEQQKEQAKKDYTKEQSGAYGDFIRQTNQHGVNAEQMAMQGLTGSGYSESLKVAEFTAYQNRVATARDGLNKVMMNYDNNIQQAILQNNSNIAQIYSEASLKQAEILLEGFQYKNNLLIEQANKELELKQFYSNEWQRQLDQINTENALAENVRQYNETTRIQQEQWQKEYNQTIAEFEEQKRQFDVEMERLKKKDDAESKYQAEQLALAKREVELAENKFKAEQEQYKVAETKVVKNPSNNAREKGYTNTEGNINKTTQIKTDYYSGPIAENVGGFGYMAKDKNGVAYQPKGVYENGTAVKLAKSGKTAKQMLGKGVVNSSGVNIENQNVWKGGKYYYIWNGTANSYEIVGTVK